MIGSDADTYKSAPQYNREKTMRYMSGCLPDQELWFERKEHGVSMTRQKGVFKAGN
jgi:hypothetical protein